MSGLKELQVKEAVVKAGRRGSLNKSNDCGMFIFDESTIEEDINEADMRK